MRYDGNVRGCGNTNIDESETESRLMHWLGTYENASFNPMIYAADGNVRGGRNHPAVFH